MKISPQTPFPGLAFLLLVGIGPTKVFAKGGGAHSSGESSSSSKSGSSSESSSFSKNSGSSSSSGSTSSSPAAYRPPVIIHTSQTTCIDQNTCVDGLAVFYTLTSRLICRGQFVQCPSAFSKASIAGIVIGSSATFDLYLTSADTNAVPVAGAILVGFLLWYVVYRYLPRRRERNFGGSSANEIITEKSPYQPLDGHVHPEGMIHTPRPGGDTDSVYTAAYTSSVSDSSTLYGYDTENDKKITAMPEPGKEYV